MICIIFGLTLALSSVSGLKIGAFNIRSFGDSKMSNPEVISILLKILPRYDIVLIQEVRDSRLSAVETLMTELNSHHDEPQYSCVVSDPLGRDTYKERYLFVYRSPFRDDKVSVQDSYHYHDHNLYTGEDVFSREPFVVHFKCSKSVIQNFVLVPLHAAPKDAVNEIDALYDVYSDVMDKFKTDNILFLGDFNAGCSYVSDSDWDSIRLHTHEHFLWLIPHDVDTTVGPTHCAYDRIVVSGEKLQNAIVEDSAQVFNFHKAYKLTLEQALAVSDHYPVELKLMLA